jgi:thiamine pyrophosphokinase
MKRAVIFLHGNKPNDEDIKKFVNKSDFIICADGGTEYALEGGLIPDIVLGDFDSLSPKFQKRLKELGIPLQSFPTDKDFTDSELAIDFATKKGYKDLVFFGAVGSRIDHFLANITHLVRKIDEGANVTLVDNTQILYLTNYELDLTGKKGDHVSLIPLIANVKNITTTGLKWQLYKDKLEFGATRGISNEFIKRKAHISVGKGILLIVQQKSAE